MSSRCAFVKLMKHFESTGENAKKEDKGSRSGIPDKDVKFVEQYFLDNKESHLREANRVSGMFLTNIYTSKENVLCPSPVQRTVHVENHHVVLEEGGVKLSLNVVDTPG